MNPEPHYIIPASGVVNLSELITTTKTTTEKPEDIKPAESVEAAIQHVVGDAGQRVITMVTDQHRNLQLASLSQQFFVTPQGQQMVALPASAITEEAVEEETQQMMPTHKRKPDSSASHISPKEKKLKENCEQLERQLQEAKRKAQGYREQLLQKEREAERYRLRLEQAMSTSNNTIATINGAKLKQEEEEEEEEQLQITGGVAVEEKAAEEDRMKGEEEEELKLPEDAIFVNEGELDVAVEDAEGTEISPDTSPPPAEGEEEQDADEDAS
ncbi:hypothetical protein LDENG_00201950 [Lucifuga dentata]|nr:hypothetical protein LDENG_00201950 [Lucifuga dentata]